MDITMQRQGTLADFEEAVVAARVVYDHSLATIAHKKKASRPARRAAFLSVFQTSKYGVRSFNPHSVVTSSLPSPCTKTDKALIDIEKSSTFKTKKAGSRIQVFINTTVRSPICLRLHPSTSISFLKGLIHEKIGVEEQTQHLFTRKNFELCDALSLEDHRIENDTNIELRLVSGLMGGTRHRKKNNFFTVNKKKEANTTSDKEAKEKTLSPKEQPEEGCQDSKTDYSTVKGAKASTPPSHLDDAPEEEGRMASAAAKDKNFGPPLCENSEKKKKEADNTKSDEETKKQTLSPEEQPEEGYNDSKTDYSTVGGAKATTPPSHLYDVHQEEELVAHAAGKDNIKQPAPGGSQGLPKKSTTLQQNLGGPDHRDINITNASNIHFGDCEGNTYNYYGPVININVTSQGKTDDGWEERLLQQSKELLKKELNSWFEQRFEKLVELIGLARGSVKLIVGVKSHAALDRLRMMCSNGEIAEKLMGFLGDEGHEDISAMELQVTMPKSDYDQACRFFTNMQKESNGLKLPVRMSDWTKEHTRDWLVDIGLPDAVANTFYNEGIDGKVLARYTKQDLEEDFEILKKGDLRRIVYSKEDWLKSETPSLSPKVKEMYIGTSQPPAQTSSERPDPLQLTTDANVADVETILLSSVTDKNLNTLDPVRDVKTQHRTKGFIDQPQSGILGEHTLNTGEMIAKPSLAVRPKNTKTKFKSTKQMPKNIFSTLPDKIDSSENLTASVGQTGSEEVGSTRPGIKKKVTYAQKIHKVSTDIGNNEFRLRRLLTGSDNGELDQHYPVLVANEPQDHPDTFTFIKTVKWITVLDFNSKSLSNGLCRLYHNDRVATLQFPEVFKDTKGDEDFCNRIEFPEKTLWIFANGREDNPSIEAPRMEFQNWNMERSSDVEASISFFSKPSVIPEGRAVIIFLILSGDDIDILCDTFRKMASSFRGLRNITCIAEDQRFYSMFVEGVARWFTKGEIDKRSFVGQNWHEINRIIMRINGVIRTGDNELPFGTAGGSCVLAAKTRETWSDVTVICRNECENTDMDESNPSYKKFVEGKELDFYRGNKVDWWNFAIDDSNRRSYKGCSHVLKRECFEELNDKIQKPLKRSLSRDSLIVTLTLLHEPGAGGSTLARHVLWTLRKQFRCVVVNRVTINTVKEILEVRKHGYNNEPARNIPPVCVLIDDLDDEILFDLIGALEDASKHITLDGGAVCVLLHCRRSMESDKVIGYRGNKLVIPLHQKLKPAEKKWFQGKYEELESKEKKNQTGEYNPENLLAFMVMKEEFNKDYIKNVVSRILSDIKPQELPLVKMCALLNSYLLNATIPVSCCDSFMGGNLTYSTQGIHLTQERPLNWEFLVSPAFWVLVTKTEHNEIKILHKRIAEEALKQMLNHNKNQSLVEVTREFLTSELLRSRSYTRPKLTRTTHDLLIKREVIADKDATRTEFSLLIEDINKVFGKDQSIEVLKLGFEILEDAYVAQHLARIFLKEKKFTEAHEFIDKALHVNSKNSYFWDTKGRIYKSSILDESEQLLVYQNVMDDEKTGKFISLAFEAMEVFHKSYDVSKHDWNAYRINYTGLYGEIDVAFQLLRIIYVCVEPFRTHGDMYALRDFILNVERPKGKVSKAWHNECLVKLRTVKDRVGVAMGIMDDITTYYKDGSHSSLMKRKLDEMKSKMIYFSGLCEKYFGEPFPRISVNEDQDSSSMVECRRRNVSMLQCGTFRDIFDNIRLNNVSKIEESRRLLLKNAGDYNFFDLRSLICIHLALSSSGIQNLSADEVHLQLVRPFNSLRRSNSYYPPFFMMMFLWPIEGMKSERKDKNSLNEHIELLKRASVTQKATSEELSHQHRDIRQARNQLKPRTYFFLGSGQGLRVFAHISELLTKWSIDDDAFWQSDTVTKRLVRLEGIVITNTSLLYRSPLKADQKINIKLAVPYKGIASQEVVTFYLGFNFAGPVAYDVTAKNQASVGRADNMPRFHEAYPKYMLPSDKPAKFLPTNKFITLQKECKELKTEIEKLEAGEKEKGLKNIQRRTDIKKGELKKKQEEIIRVLQEEEVFYSEVL